MKRFLCCVLTGVILLGCCFSLSGCETYETDYLLGQLKYHTGLWGHSPNEVADNSINEMFEMYEKLKPHEKRTVQRDIQWQLFLSDVDEYEKDVEEYIHELKFKIAELPAIEQITPSDQSTIQEILNIRDEYLSLSDKYRKKVTNASKLEDTMNYLEKFKKTCPTCKGEGMMICTACGGDGIRTIYGTYPVSGEKYIIGQERCGSMMYCPTCNGTKFVYGD